jgi:hypothetical protein
MGSREIATLSILLVSQAHAAPLVDIDFLNRALTLTRGTWAAGRTSMSDLDEESAAKLFSPFSPAADIEFLRPSSPAPSTFAEDALDWRRVRGRDWTTPVRRQGECNSCTAMAAAATLETQHMIATGLPGGPQFSAQGIFSCGGGECHRGWHSSRAADFVLNSGVPDEACFPYVSGATGMDTACSLACADRARRSVRAISLRRPTRGERDVEAVKAALKLGPLMTSMFIFPDFLAYKSGVYRHLSGAGLGRHAVSIVGYSDRDRAWIIKNSWGSDWGEDGFARVAWDDASAVGMETWGFDLAPPSGALVVDGVGRGRPEDFGNQWGEIRIAFSATAGARVSKLVISSPEGQSRLEEEASGESISFDTRRLPDGEYLVRVRGEGASGASLESAPRVLRILNGAPRATLSVRPLNFSPNRPAQGRLLFEIFPTYAPLPPSRIELRVERADGSLLMSKRLETVTPEVLMAWNVAEVEAGFYQVKIEGAFETSAGSVTFEAPSLQVQVKGR